MKFDQNETTLSSLKIHLVDLFQYELLVVWIDWGSSNDCHRVINLWECCEVIKTQHFNAIQYQNMSVERGTSIVCVEAHYQGRQNVDVNSWGISLSIPTLVHICIWLKLMKVVKRLSQLSNGNRGSLLFLVVYIGYY